MNHSRQSATRLRPDDLSRFGVIPFAFLWPWWVGPRWAIELISMDSLYAAKRTAPRLDYPGTLEFFDRGGGVAELFENRASVFPEFGSMR